MILLRLLANVLFYSAFGLLIYWLLVDDIAALWIAISFGIVSAILFMLTADYKRSRRHDSIDPLDMWDWWSITDLLEIPLQLFGWILSRLWRIFD